MPSEFGGLVDADNGLVSRRIFIEPEIDAVVGPCSGNAEYGVILEVYCLGCDSPEEHAASLHWSDVSESFSAVATLWPCRSQ